MVKVLYVNVNFFYPYYNISSESVLILLYKIFICPMYIINIYYLISVHRCNFRVVTYG